jgi:hypothetical protein
MPDPSDLLITWLARRTTPEAMAWLADKCAQVTRDQSSRTLALAFSGASRRVGKNDLVLDEADLAAAERARPNWTPVGLSADRAARIVLLLAAASGAEAFATRLQTLASTADVGELIAIYQDTKLCRSILTNPAWCR